MHSIGTAARMSGVAVETIRFYERTGVLPPAARSASGRRLYNAEAVSRLRFVRRCRDLGISLDGVRMLMSLADDRGACSDVRAIGEHHLSAIRARIASLRRLESEMVELIRPCDGGPTECPALRTLFADRNAYTSPA